MTTASSRAQHLSISEVVRRMIAEGRRTMRAPMGRVTIALRPGTHMLEVRVQRHGFIGNSYVQTLDGLVPFVVIEDEVFDLDVRVFPRPATRVTPTGKANGV